MYIFKVVIYQATLDTTRARNLKKIYMYIYVHVCTHPSQKGYMHSQKVRYTACLFFKLAMPDKSKMKRFANVSAILKLNVPNKHIHMTRL